MSYNPKKISTIKSSRPEKNSAPGGESFLWLTAFFNGEGVAAGLIFQRMVLPVKINKKCSGNHESA